MSFNRASCLLVSVLLISSSTITARAGLSREEAVDMVLSLWAKQIEELQIERAEEMEARVLRLGDLEMPFEFKSYGERPEKGWSLFISMHGGGGAPTRVNDSQWKNQIRLGDAYLPSDAIYVAPRAPTDTWNLWHQEHIDAFFQRLIENFVALEDVEPNRVYLMGYSAGGDGAYQLAPRMADRLAAAAMMAGHPNETVPLGLRNIGFTLHVGELDDGYQRNAKATEWKMELKALREQDPDGYAHEVVIHRGKGHWMDLEDRAAVPWMQDFVRDPRPDRVVWLQDDVTREQFYWLALPKGTAEKGQHVVAEVEGQTIRVEQAGGIDRLLIRLDDELLDLDQPVTVIGPNGETRFSGAVERSPEVIERTLAASGDRHLSFCAEIEITLQP